MPCSGVEWLSHYIDDFVTLGRPNILGSVERTGGSEVHVYRMGAPTGWWERRRPSCSNHLGSRGGHGRRSVKITPGTVGWMMALVAVHKWQGIKLCHKRDLLSTPSHACKVVRVGR